MRKNLIPWLLTAGSIFATAAMPVAAQDATSAPSGAAPPAAIASNDEAISVYEDASGIVDAKGEIVVTAARIRGSVETKVPPVDELAEADITALGASSVADIVSSLAPQTGSGRGRGGGQPVILLNGQRISSFREIRDLPSEAIKKVEVFPEEVALQYGYRADQRVMNFILKDNFASFSAETEYAAPQKGGFDQQEFETTFTRIGKDNRLSIDLEFERRTRLTEDERNIRSSEASAPFALAGNISALSANGEIDPTLSAAAGSVVSVAGVPTVSNPSLADFAANANVAADGDIGRYRSLLPSTQRFQATAAWSKSLSPQTGFSLNSSYELQDQQSLLGLPSASFILPASSPFSPFSSDVQLNRYFLTPRPLARNSSAHNLQFGAGLNSTLADWRLALTADYQLVDTETRTFNGNDLSALRAAVTAGTANPFDTGFGSDLLSSVPDTTDNTSGNLALRGTLSGKAFRLPGGAVQMTLRTGYERQTVDSMAYRRGVTSEAALKRDNINAGFNIEVPLIERGLGALGVIGDLAINGNMGFTELSDYGMLVEFGGGLRWSPAQSLSISASMMVDENAPTLAQLGGPQTLTPNVSYFDFQRGESRFIEVLSGGNPTLSAEKRTDFWLVADWQPKFIEGLGLQAGYYRNRSRNTTASFPLLTPEIEAAFGSRVTRDTNGQLVRIDQRPVNYEQENSERIRWGFNMSGAIGPQPQGRGAGGAPGGGRPAGAGSGGPPGAGGPRGGGRGGPMGMPGMGGPPSRWQIALYHTYRLQDEIVIGPGIAALDLLNGSATGSLGGSPRHEVTLSGGVFVKGLGLRLEGTYRNATRVDGNSLTGSGDLRFGDLASLNAFVFINLDQRGKLTKTVPFLKGGRIAIRVVNVLNDVIDVRDASGAVPLSYQPGLLDPQGRMFEISFRKRF